jgi:hypothetical protein
MKSIKLLFLVGIIVTSACLCGPFLAYGQKTTEQFIPMGKSPGVSNKQTIIGEIEQFDARSRTLTVTVSSGKQTYQLTDKTRIWLDRTKIQLTNLKGTTADLQKGRRVEVKYEAPERKTVADWVKVEITQANTQ